MFRKQPYLPAYPYDKTTDIITLPADVETRIRRIAAAGNKVDAVKEVSLLTGAGLRLSKRYVDKLITTRKSG